MQQKIEVPLRMVDENDLDSLDFRNASLPLGVRLETKEQDCAWLALGKEDWEVLVSMLLFPVGSDKIRAVDESNSLQQLCRFGLAAIRFYEKEKPKERPQEVEPWRERTDAR